MARADVAATTPLRWRARDATEARGYVQAMLSQLRRRCAGGASPTTLKSTMQIPLVAATTPLRWRCEGSPFPSVLTSGFVVDFERSPVGCSEFSS